MNFSDFITDNGKKVNKEHYLHLIQVSRADGKITQDEFDLLHKEGRKFGLTDPEIDEMIRTEALNQYLPPYSLDEKFEHLYNIAQMILADSVITDSERKLMRKFAIEAGFEDKAIDKLIKILFEGIKTEPEDALLSKFKSQLFKD
jgi:uncharacterized tellurite resistance protein B-like protein